MSERLSFREEPITPHDWPEDFEHENGNYWNTCSYCDEVFVGHKGRVCCKVCHGGGSGDRRSRVLKALAWLGIIAIIVLGFCAIAAVSGGSR